MMSDQVAQSSERSRVATDPASDHRNGLFQLRIRPTWRFLTAQPASYWLICTYLFFEYVRPQSIYPSIDVLPWARIIIILCAFALVFEGKKLWIHGPADMLLILFTFVVLASSATAYSPERSFTQLPLFLTWVIAYFLITNIVVTEKRFLVFILSFLLYNLKMSQHATLSWAKIGFAFRDWGVAGAPGWFQNSGEFGIEMTIFLPLSTFFLIALRRYWGRLKRLVFALLPATAVIGIVASSSRGAIIGGAAVGLWMIAKSRYKFSALLAVAFVTVAALMIIPPEQITRFSDAGEDKTSTERLERWDRAIRIGNEFPLLGIGYRNWSIYSVNSGEVGVGPGVPHNVFLDAFAELGYSGLIVFLLLIGATLSINHRTRQRSDRILGPRSFPYYMAHGLDAALVGFLVSGSFVSVLYYPFFWINLAMTTALHRTVRS